MVDGVVEVDARGVDQRGEALEVLFLGRGGGFGDLLLLAEEAFEFFGCGFSLCSLSVSASFAV